MLQIQKMISKYNHYDYNNPKYIVIHYVGAQNSTAKNNAVYFNGGDRQASAHYFVDDNEIWQSVEDLKGSWAIGNTLTEVNNQNSISIEMCCFGANLGVTEKTENNTVELVKHLMKKYNIPIANVRTHAEVTKYTKTCPNWSANNWARWNNFKMKLVENNIKEEVKVVEDKVKYFVQYGNSVDSRAIDYLCDVLKCGKMDSNLDYSDYGKVENLIAIGGVPSSFGKFSGYTKYWIKGSDRYDTAIRIIEVSKAIAKGGDFETVMKEYKIN